MSELEISVHKSHPGCIKAQIPIVGDCSYFIDEEVNKQYIQTSDPNEVIELGEVVHRWNTTPLYMHLSATDFYDNKETAKISYGSLRRKTNHKGSKITSLNFFNEQTKEWKKYELENELYVLNKNPIIYVGFVGLKDSSQLLLK